MFSLMLDQRFKTLCLMFSLIVHEQTKAIVEECDKKKLFPILFKCHYLLHPLAESKVGVVNHKIEEDNNLDIFVMTTQFNQHWN